MKYVHWCNDGPLKYLFTQILESCGSNVYPGRIRAILPSQRLTRIKQIVKPREIIFDRNLQELFSKKGYGSRYYSQPRTMGEFRIYDTITPDILAFKDGSLITMELKSRLFHLINSQLRKNTGEINYYDHYHIRYHFSSLIGSYSAFLNLLAFKDYFKNTSRLFHETIDGIVGAAELFRYCLLLDAESLKQAFSKKIFPNSDYRIINRFVGLGVPSYITSNQEQAIKESLEDLKEDFSKLEFEHEIYLFLAKLYPRFSSDSDDPVSFSVELIPFFTDQSKLEILTDAFKCNSPFPLDFTNFLTRKRFERDLTKWKSCMNCTYFKRCQS